MRDRDLGVTWGAYIGMARKNAGMTKTQLAKAARVGRATVFRWESGEQRPERAEVVMRVVDVLGLDLDEALIAAGLRPADNPPAEPSDQQPPIDPEVAELNRRLQDPEVSDAEKNAIRVLIRYATDRAEWEPPAEPGRRRAVS